MSYRWVVRSVEDPDTVTHLQKQLNDLPEALTRALVLRGVDTFERARAYFRPSVESLHDPFLMESMDVAAERVAEAISCGERVLVYGDYDVDGTTATALMTSFLQSQGVEASFFIPNRFEHGYGLNKVGIDLARERGASLIIALDCGITAVDEAAYAREQGIDLIICDHHTASAQMPDALAILDPKRPECSYPFDELSGCGVGFKLAQAVLHLLEKDPRAMHDYLDLVAVSTASDIVPLRGENRVLMREGLKQLGQTQRTGIQAMAAAADLDLNKMTSTRIVFTIGPRINAAGRLGDAERAVRLLLSEDSAEAGQLAGELERINKERRTIDRQTADEAVSKAETHLSGRHRHAIVLHDEDWHQGVIGIVASRIVEHFYRPTVMLSGSGNEVKGSARSIVGVNIYNALSQCEDLLLKFGGHDYAAGMTLCEDDVPEFRERLNDAIAEVTTPEMLIPAIEIDAELDLGSVEWEIDSNFWKVLKQFAPFGPQNMRPVFLSRQLSLARPPRTVGRDGDHLKLSVEASANGRRRAPLDVIGFNLGDKFDALRENHGSGGLIDLVYSVEENTYRGITKLQLKARDVRVSADDSSAAAEKLKSQDTA